MLQGRWDAMFDKLLRFKQLHGHCRVPRSYPEEKSLAQWVSHQRTMSRTNQLESSRKARLDSLGFVWRVSKEDRRNLLLKQSQSTEAEEVENGETAETDYEGRVGTQHEPITRQETRSLSQRKRKRPPSPVTCLLYTSPSPRD